MQTINIDKIGSNFDIHQYIHECIKDNKMNIQFWYSSDFKNAKILREFMEEILVIFNFPKRDVVRLILACDEMNNNAIEYWSRKKEINYLRVKIIKRNKILSLSIEVEDTGNGKFSKTAEEMELCKQNRINEDYKQHKSIRWRGLFLIIINIVDELYFKNTKTGWLIVGFKKDLLI